MIIKQFLDLKDEMTKLALAKVFGDDKRTLRLIDEAFGAAEPVAVEQLAVAFGDSEARKVLRIIESPTSHVGMYRSL